MKAILEVNQLKVRRSVHFDLSIESVTLQSGDILCVTGPNGSGKTTFIECLNGLLSLTKGSITIKGHYVNENLRKTKALIGFVPDDEEWLIKELSAREYFTLLAHIYTEAGAKNNMPLRIAQLAKDLQFTTFSQSLHQLSHGNKKKVQIIAGLMHAPAVIILDELRNGLDPLAIIAAEQIIKKEAKRGACIVAATHDLWWAERIASHILLLREGKVVAHKKTTDIIKDYTSLEKFFIQSVGLHE